MTTDLKNNLFAVNLLFQSLRNQKDLPSNLWEESIILIEALTTEEAQEKATQIGIAREFEYKTVSGDVLAWKFYKVERIFSIDADTISNGTELFSRHLRAAEVASLLKPFDIDSL